VIYITFGGFALLDYFVSCLKHLPAPESGGSLPSSTHNPPTFTLKTRLKPTRRDAGARFERKWNPKNSNPGVARSRFHLLLIGGPRLHGSRCFGTFSGGFASDGIAMAITSRFERHGRRVRCRERP